MRIAGEATVRVPVEQAWDGLLDPTVLVRTIPGCERLETTGEHTYAMTVTAGVAAVRGTYEGLCRLSDLEPHESLVMRLSGAGAPGTIDATVQVRFSGDGGTTTIGYDADAVVGGMVGGVGQRMLTSVSRRMAAEFFGNVERVLAGGEPAPAAAPSTAGPSAGEPAEAGASAPVGQVFTAPAADRSDRFLEGVALGAGLVLLGVLAGSVVGRRR